MTTDTQQKQKLATVVDTVVDLLKAYDRDAQLRILRAVAILYGIEIHEDNA